jgi:hypothetical protein
VHLLDVESVLEKEESVVELSHHSCLNFKKWVALKNKIMELMRHRDGLERYCAEAGSDGAGLVDLLRAELSRGVVVNPEFGKLVMTKGEELQVQEEELIGTNIMDDTRW